MRAATQGRPRRSDPRADGSAWLTEAAPLFVCHAGYDPVAAGYDPVALAVDLAEVAVAAPEQAPEADDEQYGGSGVTA